jgi:hypothetical protein
VAPRSPIYFARLALGVAVCAALMIFFVRAGDEHGRRINVSKARGDQSGYLMDAENVYHNAHGRQPKKLIGERNRMPVYAWYLSLFYDPTMSDPQFFEVGRRANVRLALGLLVLIAIVVSRLLPWLTAVNLVGVAAFGWFIYKAGYTQSELLYYTLFFFAFLSCWGLFRAKTSARSIALGALAGALCGLAYLTKAAIPPFIAVFGLTFGARTLLSGTARGKAGGGVVSGVTALLVFTLAFLAVLSPYLATNKRAFGRYFYNVNSTFYVWYDDWPDASVGTRLHGDGEHWPDMPESALPGAGRYWREHSLGQIGERVWRGVKDMAIVSYRTFDYLPFLILYSAFAATIAVTRRALFVGLVRDHAWLAAFLGIYFVAYFFATAFYHPVSGTGTARFLIAHLLPYFFVISHLISRSRLRSVEWTAGSLRLRPRQFEILVLVLLVLDVSLRTWPRLMSTYGGF